MTTLQPRISLPSFHNRGVAYAQAPSHSTSVPSPSLASAVEAAVNAFDERRLIPVFPDDSGPVVAPKILLALLCFSYARGIYASKDIDSALRQDSNLLRLCPGAIPDVWVLRHFRRPNREALRKCLLAAVWFTAQQNVAAA